METHTNNINEDKTYPDFLDERYTSISKIGQGGMGAVYRAFDNILLKDVVIKVILKQDDYEKHAIEFQKEAKTLSRLKNDNLVTVYDFGVSDTGTLYMVLEYLDGNTLAQVIDRAKFLTPVNALPLFIQICKGLIHAHANNVIHRDLKPENIIVTELDNGDKQVKIIDFGIARLEDGNLTTTSTQVIKGSPHYMAPETIQGGKATAFSDIYSLGCLMFKTLTGSPPFRRDTTFEIYNKHNNEPVPLISEIKSECPSDLSVLVEKCMNKDPTQRYQSISVIEEELNNIYHGRIDTQPETGLKLDLPEELPSPENRPLKLLIGLFALFILLVGGLTTYSLVSDKMLSKDEDSAGVKRGASLPSFEKVQETVADPFRIGSVYDEEAWVAKLSSLDDDQIAAILLKKKPLNISLQHCSANGTFMEKLKDWPINTLRLESSDITDLGLRSISNAKAIRRLDLTATTISDKGLVYLKEMPHLQHLELSMCANITEQGIIGVLENCKNLTSIKLKHLKLKDSIIPYLVAKNLSTIEIADNDLSDNAIARLAKIPNLREIDLSGNKKISKETFLLFANLPELSKLECSNLPSLKKRTIDLYKKKFELEGKTFNCKNLYGQKSGFYKIEN